MDDADVGVVLSTQKSYSAMFSSRLHGFLYDIPPSRWEGQRFETLKNLTQECAASRVCLIPKSLLATCVKQFELLRIRAWSCSVMKPIPLIFPALEHMSVNIHRSLILQPPLAFCCFHIPLPPFLIVLLSWCLKSGGKTIFIPVQVEDDLHYKW